MPITYAVAMDREVAPPTRTDADPSKALKPIKLSQQQRFMAVVGGIGLLSIGSWGFLASDHDGVGTVAFVTAGTLCGLLGIIGRVPTRLSGKDYSMEIMGDADELAQATLEVLSREQVVELVIGLSDEKRSTLTEAAMYKAAASSLAYEEMVTNLFLSIANKLQMKVQTHPNIDKFDLQLEASRKGRILVAIINNFSAERRLRRQLHDLSDVAKGHGATALIVTRSIAPIGINMAAELPRINVITGATEGELAPKIERALS